MSGRDPEGRSYFSFVSFEDPDGNHWLLQEITTRLPGREWEQKPARAMDVATLAALLRETSEHHDHFEKNARGTSLVGLVRALLERASERQQSGGRRRSLHG